MDKIGEVITEHNYPDIYKWLSENVTYFKDYNKQDFTLTSDNKINAYCDVKFDEGIRQIKYPFGYVWRDFSCIACYNLTSLINSPKKVDGRFVCISCESLYTLIGFPKHIGIDIRFFNGPFSNNPSKTEEYKLYLAMWLELLESVTNKEREIYVKSYKDKVDWDNKQPIIPIEILKEYGF